MIWVFAFFCELVAEHAAMDRWKDFAYEFEAAAHQLFRPSLFLTLVFLWHVVARFGTKYDMSRKESKAPKFKCLAGGIDSCHHPLAFVLRSFFGRFHCLTWISVRSPGVYFTCRSVFLPCQCSLRCLGIADDNAHA